MNLCTECGEEFGSLAAFDAHRYGTFEPLNRACMTAQELHCSPRFGRNSRGRWSLATSLAWGQKHKQYEAETAAGDDDLAESA
jgi:hypothetical protein